MSVLVLREKGKTLEKNFKKLRLTKVFNFANLIKK